MPEFTKVWSVANIALIKLTAKLAKKLNFVPSIKLLCEITVKFIREITV